jgi:radical SAM/Cys-rich protein
VSRGGPTPLHILGQDEFDRRVASAAVGCRPLAGLSIDTVQANIGLRCNLACHHCHVESGPGRREEMSWETMGQVLDAARRAGAATLDITGGAPEMHPHFRRFVAAARAQDLGVIDRTNLTILLEPGYADLPAFLRGHQVRLIASLPCYLAANVDGQRGRGVYAGSIEAIRRLNAIGYGTEPDLPLDLVYNPAGPSLPPPQHALEADYRRELLDRFGIRFSRLLALTNVPIGRFLHDLERQGRAAAYRETLAANFNPATLPGLMCRHQLHVGWDGTVYDCDFNFALGLPANDGGARERRHVRDFDPERFCRREIATGAHCFACTAGAGSSCGGAVV